MAYSHENRVKYIVRYFYDIENNGVLDKNDFRCLAVRNTIVETRGDFPQDVFETNLSIMENLWNEIAQVADFDNSGEVDVAEFQQAVRDSCLSKTYDDFPAMFKAFIENQFKAVDTDHDGLIGLKEYRQDAITRRSFSDVAEIDDAYNKLLNDEDRKAGGITIDRYKELYASFLGTEEETQAMYLFGPLRDFRAQ